MRISKKKLGYLDVGTDCLDRALARDLGRPVYAVVSYDKPGRKEKRGG